MSNSISNKDFVYLRNRVRTLEQMHGITPPPEDKDLKIVKSSYITSTGISGDDDPYQYLCSNNAQGPQDIVNYWIIEKAIPAGMHSLILTTGGSASGSRSMQIYVVAGELTPAEMHAAIANRPFVNAPYSSKPFRIVRNFPEGNVVTVMTRAISGADAKILKREAVVVEGEPVDPPPPPPPPPPPGNAKMFLMPYLRNGAEHIKNNLATVNALPIDGIVYWTFSTWNGNVFDGSATRSIASLENEIRINGLNKEAAYLMATWMPEELFTAAGRQKSADNMGVLAKALNNLDIHKIVFDNENIDNPANGVKKSDPRNYAGRSVSEVLAAWEDLGRRQMVAMKANNPTLKVTHLHGAYFASLQRDNTFWKVVDGRNGNDANSDGQQDNDAWNPGAYYMQTQAFFQIGQFKVAPGDVYSGNELYGHRTLAHWQFAFNWIKNTLPDLLPVFDGFETLWKAQIKNSATVYIANQGLFVPDSIGTVFKTALKGAVDAADDWVVIYPSQEEDKPRLVDYVGGQTDINMTMIQQVKNGT